MKISLKKVGFLKNFTQQDDDKITILIESNQLSHLRANLNSCLRLIQTSYDSIESLNI